MVPAAAEGAWRPRGRAGRHGGLLRGDEPLDLRAGDLQRGRAGRRQHDDAGRRRHAGAAEALARADPAGRGGIGFRDDRAGTRRRLRSVDDPDPRRAPARRLLSHHRAQMVHHRRRERRSFHPDRPHLRRPAARADRIPVPQGPAGLAHRPPHRDHGTGGARRPLRDGIRRARGAGRRGAARRGPRPQGDADPARTGAPHPLHALARPRQALRRDRPRRRSGTPRRRQPPRRSRYARQARLVDGADEVHQMVLNRFLDEEGPDFWRWPVAS